MNMKLKKILDDIQKTEDKIAELQEHLKRQNTLKQQMEDMEIIKSNWTAGSCWYCLTGFRKEPL